MSSAFYYMQAVNPSCMFHILHGATRKSIKYFYRGINDGKDKPLYMTRSNICAICIRKYNKYIINASYACEYISPDRAYKCMKHKDILGDMGAWVMMKKGGGGNSTPHTFDTFLPYLLDLIHKG